jgi:hypothetical protein
MQHCLFARLNRCRAVNDESQRCFCRLWVYLDTATPRNYAIRHNAHSNGISRLLANEMQQFRNPPGFYP